MIELLNGDTWEQDTLLAKMHDDEFYYGYLGKNAMSSSNIKLLTKSPNHYNENAEEIYKETFNTKEK